MKIEEIVEEISQIRYMTDYKCYKIAYEMYGLNDEMAYKASDIFKEKYQVNTMDGKINKRLLAFQIGEYWDTNCPDDEFYDNCMENILLEIGHKKGPVPDIAYEIWDIIEDNFCNQ